jgi:hypothetical protein
VLPGDFVLFRREFGAPLRVAFLNAFFHGRKPPRFTRNSYWEAKRFFEGFPEAPLPRKKAGHMDASAPIKSSPQHL